MNASKAAKRRIVALALCFGALTMSSALVESGPSHLLASCSEGAVSRLYLGQSTPAGVVSEAQWRAFVVESVTSRFPEGFTELQAHGHWRDPRGTAIEEGTRIVEIVHRGELLSRKRVREVAADYKQRFAQQSVLITQAQSFHCL